MTDTCIVAACDGEAKPLGPCNTYRCAECGIAFKRKNHGATILGTV